jgi:putative spermidine/putrescine transport system permease protein
MRRTVFQDTWIRTLVGTVLVLWFVMPFVPLAIWSFAWGWRYPDLLPGEWSLKAWTYALSDTAGVKEGLLLSLWIAVCASVLSLCIGVPAGRALGLYRFRGRAIIEMMFLAPIIVPGIASVFGIHIIFIHLGLTNTITGVVLVHLIPTLPYVVFVMSGIFANYDLAHEEQARSLGASEARAFWHVTMPAILPGIIVSGLFAFLVSWSQYILTLIVGGGRVVTLPLQLFSFATSGRHDVTGAIALIYILPGVLVLILTSRHLSGRSLSLARLGHA